VKKIWITGCFGFIGHHLAEYINGNLDDASVYGIGRASQCETLLPWQFISDISPDSLDKLFNFSGSYPDIIYHCAGTGSVGVAQQNPHEDFLSTVCSVSILLEWVRVKSPGTRIIVMSSAAIYGSGYSGPISESDKTAPASVYGYNKLLVEQLCNSYVNNFGLDIIVTRLFSVYGVGLKKQLLFDVCLKLLKLNNGDSIEVFGTGCEIRDWINIRDVVSTLIEIGYSDRFSERVVNIGTGYKKQVLDLVSLVVKSWGFNGSSVPVIFNGISRVGDPKSLLSDNTLRSSICHHDDIPLADGVDEYVNWFKECYGK